MKQGSQLCSRPIIFKQQINCALPVRTQPQFIISVVATMPQRPETFGHTERSTSGYKKKNGLEEYMVECIHTRQEHASVSEIQLQIFEQAKETDFNGKPQRQAVETME
jgi:hypothetical protein